MGQSSSLSGIVIWAGGTEALPGVTWSYRPLRSRDPAALTHSNPPSKVQPLSLPEAGHGLGPKGGLGERHQQLELSVSQCRTRRTMGIVKTQPPTPTPEPSGQRRGQTAPHWESTGGGGCGRRRGAQLAAAASHLGGSPAAPGAPQTAAPALAPIPGEGGRQKPRRRPRDANPERAPGPTQSSGAPHPPGAGSRPRRLCLPRPGTAPLYPSRPSVPAALRTTRCSMPGGPEAARVTTATATQNAKAQAGAPIAGAGVTASSGGARQHAAPHGPALAPAGGGRRSGACRRRRATRYSGGPGRAEPEAAAAGLLRPGPSDPRPPRPPPPPPRAPGPPGAGRRLPAAVPPSPFPPWLLQSPPRAAAAANFPEREAGARAWPRRRRLLGIRARRAPWTCPAPASTPRARPVPEHRPGGRERPTR